MSKDTKQKRAAKAAKSRAPEQQQEQVGEVIEATAETVVKPASDAVEQSADTAQQDSKQEQAAEEKPVAEAGKAEQESSKENAAKGDKSKPADDKTAKANANAGQKGKQGKNTDHKKTADVKPVADQKKTDLPAGKTATPTTAVVQPAAGGGKGLSVLALLVALAGAGFSGWTWYQDQQREVPAPVVAAPVADHSDAIRAQEQQLQQLAQQVGGIKEQDGRLQQLEQQLGKLPTHSDLGKNEQVLAQLQSSHQAFVQRFEQAFGNTRQDWRLAEAEHLMRMAHLRLAALQDLNSARYLLEAADQILYEQDDPAAFAAREALTQALADVRAVPRIDRVGVFMRLSALQKQVASLDQLLPGYEGGESNTGGLEWSKLLDKASSYVRLDVGSSEDVMPLLSSRQLNDIRLALSLTLEQAQWASLNGEQEVFGEVLAQGVELLKQHFSADNHGATTMAAQLKELAEAKISQVMPDINPALVALQGYIQERTLERRAPREDEQ